MIYKPLFFLARIDEMRQCFLVDGSVLFVKGKDEPFTSVQKFFTKLRRYLPLRPPRNNELVFLVFVRVVVIPSDYYDDILPWGKSLDRIIYDNIS